MLRNAEVGIREHLAEAANLLLDALGHTPTANVPRNAQYNAELHSKHAKKFVTELRATDRSALPEAIAAWVGFNAEGGSRNRPLSRARHALDLA